MKHQSFGDSFRVIFVCHLKQRKGLDDSALELDPSFWEGAEESEWCAVYINLARRQDRRDAGAAEFACGSFQIGCVQTC